MPNIESAKKDLRQNKRRKERNLKQKRQMKEVLKKYKKLVEEDKLKEAGSLLPQVFKVLDKAAKNNIIKEGKAKRLKSRLSKKLKK